MNLAMTGLRSRLERLQRLVRSPLAHDSALLDWLARLEQKFDAFTLRERALVFGVLVALILIGWDSLIMQSMYARERVARSALDAVAPEGAESEAALTDLDQLVETEKQLMVQYNRKRGELDQRAASLIDSGAMTDVLTGLIAASQGVRLVRIANLPVEELKAPVANPEADPASADTADTQAGLADVGGVPAVAYVHGIELKVTGDYEAVNRFIESIERQSWRFIWRKVELDASEYPKINAKIVVATLGLEKYWLTI